MRTRAAANEDARDLPGQMETSSEPVTAWHTLPVDEAARRLGADPARGLTDAEAARRRRQFGPNALAEAKGRSALVDPRSPSSRASSWPCSSWPPAWRSRSGRHVEAVAILVVIVLNAVIGFLTEWKAEQALTALQKQAVPMAHVLRDGRGAARSPRPSWCPGDVVVLAAGARVPADGRVVESVRLQVEEAALTGESLAGHQDRRPAPRRGRPARRPARTWPTWARRSRTGAAGSS